MQAGCKYYYTYGSCYSNTTYDDDSNGCGYYQTYYSDDDNNGLAGYTLQDCENDLIPPASAVVWPRPLVLWHGLHHPCSTDQQTASLKRALL